jgi:F0F1-type ATP synthase membrane subunit b/b'
VGVKPAEVQLPALNAFDEDLLLAAANAPPLNPALGPSLGQSTGHKSAGFRRPKVSLGENTADRYTSVNRKFSAGIVLMTIATIATVLHFLPHTQALYVIGSVVCCSFLSVLFLTILRDSNREQFDLVYRIAAFIPAGVIALITVICTILVVWGLARGQLARDTQALTEMFAKLAVSNIILVVLGVLWLFSFRKYGFWRTYATLHLIGMVSTMAYAPFEAAVIEERRQKEMAERLENQKRHDEAQKQMEAQREQHAKEAKERHEQYLETTRLQAEISAKRQEESRKHFETIREESRQQSETRAEKSAEDDLARKIEFAFRMGKTCEGRDWLYADTITRDAADLTAKLQLCSLIKRPVINLLWAMGVETSPLADKGDAIKTARVGEALGRAAAMEMSGFEQHQIARKMAEQAGTAGVAIAKALSANCLDGRFGAWPAEPGIGRDAPNGIVLLPAGTADALMGGAKALGADLLVAANVQVKPGAGRNVNATLVVRIIDVLANKEVWRSEKLTTAQIAAAQRRNQPDPGLAIAESALVFIETNANLKPIPQLKPDAVKKRADKITKSHDAGKLAALAELRFYEKKNWLTADEAGKYYATLLGPQNGSALQSENLSDRQNAVKDLVAEQ